MFAFAQQPPPEDDIYDIVVLAPKDPVWPTYLAVLLILLLLAAVGHLLWRRFRSGKASHEISPEAEAEERLDRLAREHDEMDPADFSQAVSDALKDYLARRFRDPVRYETSQEFLERISRQRSGMPDAAQQALGKFLTESEELKFANLDAAEDRTRGLLDTARRIVGLCATIRNDANEDASA